MNFRLSHLVLLLSVVLVGCGKRNAYVEPPPPEVTVVNPIQRTVTEYLEVSGMAQPMEMIEIRARVKGFLKERLFVEGSEVKKGQLLLVIDEEPFQIQLDAANTKLKEAEAELQKAVVSKSREVARAQVKLSESQVRLARQDEQRVRSLSDKKISTEAEREQTQATREAREAELESAKANLDQDVATYDTTILSCQAQVDSAKTTVRNAALDLSYCRMASPIDGRISRVNFDVGNLVGDGQSSVLATIVKMDPIYAYATVSEADVMRTPALRTFGSSTDSTPKDPIKVDVGFAGQTSFPISGSLNYSDPSLDQSTGTLQIRGIFDNPDRALLPNMFVRMRIPVGEKSDAFLVPERSLGTDQGGRFVLVVAADGKVEYRAVRIGVSVNEMRVVEGQLALTDQVIVEGLLRARPGATVVPKLEAAPAQVSLSANLTGRK